jgi:hypothetical protein
MVHTLYRRGTGVSNVKKKVFRSKEALGIGKGSLLARSMPARMAHCSLLQGQPKIVPSAKK